MRSLTEHRELSCGGGGRDWFAVPVAIKSRRKGRGRGDLPGGNRSYLVDSIWENNSLKKGGKDAVALGRERDSE